MAIMLIESMVSIYSLLLLFAGIICFFSCILTQGASEYRFWSLVESKNDDLYLHDLVTEHFGSFFRTCYSLSLAATSGISWGEIGRAAMAVGVAYFGIFVFYMFV